MGLAQDRLEVLVDLGAVFPTSGHGAARVTCYSANAGSDRDEDFRSGGKRNVHFNYYSSRHTSISVQVSPRPLAASWRAATPSGVSSDGLRFIRVFQNGLELTDLCEHSLEAAGSVHKLAKELNLNSTGTATTA